MPRRIDHCVLPTADLEIARERLTALGFTVSPNGRHPFGTENCCVYFADGTFLEPLAIADADEVRQAIAEQNIFVARDAAYRADAGEEGFSALVFASDNADKDHADFVKAGVSGGPMLSFSRPFKDAAGNVGAASFKLAFAAEESAPDLFFFTCQRLNAPAVDRSALERHPNGVRTLKSVECHGAGTIGNLLEAATAASLTHSADLASYPLTAGDLVLTEPGAKRAQLGRITFAVQSLDRLAEILAANSVRHDRQDDAIDVPPAPGQGTAFRFVAA